MYDQGFPADMIERGGAKAVYAEDSVLTRPALGNCDGVFNMLSNGSALFSYGGPVQVDSTVRAVRLGVSGTTGGNIFSTFDEYGTIVANHFLDQQVYYTYLGNGEAAWRDTNATADQYGAAVEQFQNNVAGTISTTNGSAAIVGIGTTFTTAAIGGAAGQYTGIYNGNLASLNVLRLGDIILIDDGAVNYYHRIIAITDNTHISVYPTYAGGTGAGKSYTLWRSGYGSMSRVVSIIGDTTYFNFYVGNARGTLGTIECFTRDILTGATVTHSTAPKTNDGAGANVLDVQATDIAYYKGYLLYGYKGAISWSVSGFPTGVAAAPVFGANDFPAANITIVDNTDQFISFEYLGDQLLAMFQNSIWQIQPTGTVPEFNFYKLPEPVGVHAQASNTNAQQGGSAMYSRPTCSARNSVVYASNAGLMGLTGQTAKHISPQVFAYLRDRGVGDGTGPNIAPTWEPVTDTIYTYDPIAGAAVYNIPTDTWSVMFMPTGTLVPRGLTAGVYTPNRQFTLASYNTVNSKIYWIDTWPGAPWTTGDADTNNIDSWAYSSPVVSLGDDYNQFIVTGFQVDGMLKSGATWLLRTGKSPNQMSSAVVATGTVTSLDNRIVIGPKVSAPYIWIGLRGTGFSTASTSTGRAVIKGINLYMDRVGK
jgi:hypothetical protein